MDKVQISKSAYKWLLKKAQAFEQVLVYVQKLYPIEEYSEKRICEFKAADRIPLRLKKGISVILELVKKNA